MFDTFYKTLSSNLLVEHFKRIFSKLYTVGVFFDNYFFVGNESRKWSIQSKNVKILQKVFSGID